MIKFEFGERKSAINLENHGIDFIDAQLLWSDPDMLEIPAPMEDEIRFVVTGRINSKHWSAVITYRGTRIRIISVPRSRREEILFYES